MKNLKLLGLMLMALTLFSTQSCKKDEACEEKTWYHDGDADGEGDSGDTKKACDKPAGYVANANDPDDTNTNIFSSCTKMTYYLDNDGDTFGDPDQALELCDGAAPDKYVEDKTDCDDSNANVNPGVEDSTEDGDDYNCDGYDSNIWTGPNKVFSKDKNDDWTDPQYQDMITEKVTFTRQDNDYLFNLTWWEDNIGDGTPIHGQNVSDLGWEFWGASQVQPISNVTGHNPTGGPKDIRWALLDSGDYPTQAWQDFQLYGTLGNNTNFYSLHNIASCALILNYNAPVNNILNDFLIDHSDAIVTSNSSMLELVGRTLGVWLVEEDIYFTLKITEWTAAANGGTITYERSTPIVL